MYIYEVYICMYICIHMYTYVYICIHMNTYVYISIYLYTSKIGIVNLKHF